MKLNRFAMAIALGTLTSGAWATTVFSNVYDNGAFLPFSSNTPAGTKFGDGGWLSRDHSGPCFFGRHQQRQHRSGLYV